MARDLLSRYVWIVDTIRRYGAISRNALSEKWLKTPFSEGKPLTRRTFYNYRQAIEDLFHVTITCDPVTFEYSIVSNDMADSVTDWLLNSVAMSDVVAGARDVADRIFVEDVPSARMSLASVIDAIKEQRVMRFTYSGYTRSQATPGISLEPYFLKIFRQRWYVTGRNRRDRKLKTYALDRISDLIVTPEVFEMPEDFDARSYCRDSFGIIFDEGTVRDVMIRVDHRQAKYLRALPLHPSQSEIVHDSFSVFRYRIRLTNDFVSELLSYGPSVTVIAPAELRAMVVTRLRQALHNYES